MIKTLLNEKTVLLLFLTFSSFSGESGKFWISVVSVSSYIRSSFWGEKSGLSSYQKIMLFKI